MTPRSKRNAKKQKKKQEAEKYQDQRTPDSTEIINSREESVEQNVLKETSCDNTLITAEPKV